LRKHIRFSIEDRVARITFARPPLNIFNIAMLGEINGVLHECAQQPNLVAVVFDAGAETRAFSGGVAVEEHVAETVRQMLESFHQIFRSLARIGKPAVGVVDGPALGGGCELVAACDIVVASTRAVFGQPEIKLGVFPPVAAILLPLIIGEKKARELILTGDTINAVEASRLGLVNHVVPTAELEEKTQSVLAKLRQLSAAALRMTRTALALGSPIDLESALGKVENLYLNELMETADATEGIRAFMEKRKPEWRDR